MVSAVSASALDGGFADPVLESQAVFHAVMKAMARPGCPQDMPAGVAPPDPLTAGLAAVALTLVDADTPVWLSPSLDVDPVRTWLAFHCGCPFAANADVATFLLIGRADVAPALEDCRIGTQEYPDRGATLVLALPALEGGARLLLDGPGIDGQATVSPLGLPVDFLAARAVNRMLFPRGVDHILVAGSQILALPRSTVVRTDDPEEAG